MSLKRLQQQTENLSIPSLSTIPQLQDSLKETDVILDAIFGFSFSGPVRPPFDDVLSLIVTSKLPKISIDIPSGWDVEKGPVQREVANTEGKKVEEVLMPDVLVSLTAPKQGVKGYKGRHFLGGRFVPWYAEIDSRPMCRCTEKGHCRSMQEKFELNLPPYPDIQQIVELPVTAEEGGDQTQRL